jgi:hypothetical protein
VAEAWWSSHLPSGCAAHDIELDERLIFCLHACELIDVLETALAVEKFMADTVMTWFFRGVQWADSLRPVAAIQLLVHFQGRGKTGS